jgi:hypothetical protein
MNNDTYEYLPAPQWLGKADVAELLGLSQYENRWKGDVDILMNYLPPFPTATTKVKRVVIRFNSTTGRYFLRYSHGPLQGFFWDSYGDDFHNVGLALRALIDAPQPPNPNYGIPETSDSVGNNIQPKQP